MRRGACLGNCAAAKLGVSVTLVLANVGVVAKAICCAVELAAAAWGGEMTDGVGRGMLESLREIFSTFSLNDFCSASRSEMEWSMLAIEVRMASRSSRDLGGVLDLAAEEEDATARTSGASLGL